MRRSVQYQLSHPADFVKRITAWSAAMQPFCLLNTNGFTGQNNALEPGCGKPFDVMAGAGAVHELAAVAGRNGFDLLKQFSDAHEDWLMGFLTYDLKNHTEKLSSGNFDGIGVPDLHFFVPRYLFVLREDQLSIYYLSTLDSEASVASVFEAVMRAEHPSGTSVNPVVAPRISRENYLQKIHHLKQHIQRGDIYEVNFCQEFFAENAFIDPRRLYNELNATSPAPFSVYYASNGKYLLSASPERYLRKKGRVLYSQPIKGTARRGRTAEEDEELKKALITDPKERSENVMIVDLVRNDLSRTAVRASVTVEELFGLYTFPHVHQLISTVRSELRPDVHFVDAIRNSFPMGSMTGAPKFRAMQLIEQFEESKRGLYSGAVGYISPEKDMDFNVVIRSMLYNELSHYLSFMVGGAITILSDPEKEYEECLLKARAMLNVLGVAGQQTMKS